jgi:hypothetical protein
MSYQQFLTQYRFPSTGHHCLSADDLPEHREDEAYETDPVFDHSPDSFLPAPEGLTPLQQIEFQDLRKVAGRVVGRHEAIIKTPWFLTSQYLQKKLGCTIQEATQLADCFAILDATEAMVLDFIAQSKEMGLQVFIPYISQLAMAAAEAETPDSDDAMEQRLESFDDYESGKIGADYPQDDVEWAEVDMDDVDAWLEGSLDGAAGLDMASFQSEGWHLMDDQDTTPLWEDLQPAQFQVLLHKTQEAKTLDELKRLGQKAYGLTSWTQSQRTVFWSAWKVRRQALLLRAETNISRVRKAVAKIRQAGAQLPQLGKRLFEFAKANPNYYPADGWAAIWQAYKDQKAALTGTGA